jgi:hypothetical protein
MRRKYEFKKNDFILLLIIGAVILLLNYFLNWHDVYKQHNLNTAIISKYITEVTKEEFQTYIEENPNAFVYFGIIDEEKSRNFENRFKKTIVKYHLRDNVIYLNVKNLDYNELIDEYKGDKNYTLEVPMIVYFENKKVVDLINYNNSDMSDKNTIKFFRKYGE